ncbi:TetR/AcrR family transcriptional regulator [Streptomyces griseus]|uniref:TetR/AcrR family transcriptional regulator n=1 Tax=Streptomyces griseus TaxID=1911 RepID=UPI00084081B3|nr:TetR/AcrR family transcriptional regulator [Streptomyces griseus]
MPAQTSHKPPQRGLRADARENRDRILRAAREAFATQGIDVPVAAIARRAGVGVATLYRRFPTRDALVTEAFAEQLGHCVSVLDEGLADPDPWRGFCTVVERVCLMQAADRGFTQAFLTEFPDQADFARERSRAEEGLALLIRRAKEAGALRQDFEPGDVTLLLLANCGVTSGAGEEAATASRRLAAYLLHAFRADAAAPLPRPARLGLERIHA